MKHFIYIFILLFLSCESVTDKNLNLIKSFPIPVQTTTSEIIDTEDFFTRIDTFKLSNLVAQSSAVNKPLLIFITGDQVVNSRIFESRILSQKAVQERLKNDFFAVSLYTDDRTPLAKEDYYISKVSGAKINTLGKQVADFEKTQFDCNMQPFFAIYDSNGLVLSESKYIKDDYYFFINFLNDGLSSFNKND